MDPIVLTEASRPLDDAGVDVLRRGRDRVAPPDVALLDYVGQVRAVEGDRARAAREDQRADVGAHGAEAGAVEAAVREEARPQLVVGAQLVTATDAAQV